MFCSQPDVRSPKSQLNMNFIFQVKMDFKHIYLLLNFVQNILIISTSKWPLTTIFMWNGANCGKSRARHEKSSCFHRTFRFFQNDPFSQSSQPPVYEGYEDDTINDGAESPVNVLPKSVNDGFSGKHNMLNSLFC